MTHLSQKIATTSIPSVALFTAVLAVASLASTGMMQTNDAAAETIIEKYKFKEGFAVAFKTITEGSITMSAYTSAIKSTNPSIGSILCVFLTEHDVSTNTYPLDFGGCASNVQLTVTGLNSATFSGTVRGTDHATGEDKTVTVSVDLTGTGKVQTGTFSGHFVTPSYDVVINSNSEKFRSAIGSLDISDIGGEGITFHTDDASGTIGNSREGRIIVSRL
jgi:hypothetical protein